MSVQEAPQRASSPVLVKPEAKPRPEIPPKPSTQPNSPPPGDRGSSTSVSEGKVKRIVNKFSTQEQVPKESGEKPSNGTAEFKAGERLKRPPTIKPKPGRASLQLQLGGEQAPPLPVKRSKKQKESERGEDGDSISVEGGRSGTVELTRLLGSLQNAFCLCVDLLLLHNCCCILFYSSLFIKFLLEWWWWWSSSSLFQLDTINIGKLCHMISFKWSWNVLDFGCQLALSAFKVVYRIFYSAEQRSDGIINCSLLSCSGKAWFSFPWLSHTTCSATIV